MRTADSAAHELGPLVDPGLDQVLHLGELRGVGEWADHRLLIVRIGDKHGGRGPGRKLFHLGEARTRNHHARRRGAALADIAHGAKHALGHGIGEIGIVEEDVG